MKNRLISFGLFLILLFSFISCSTPPEPEIQPGSISASEAFADTSLPEVFISPSDLAFYQCGEDGNAVVDVVPASSVIRDPDDAPLFPRTRFYDQFIPETMLPLLDEIDYAIIHGYSRFVFLLQGFSGTDIHETKEYLELIYRVNAQTLTFRPVLVPTENDETNTYMIVSLSGLERKDATQKFLKGLSEARRIVGRIPKDMTQAEAAVYLYSYLANNTYYDYGEYYEGNDWNLLYDALIKHNTVCAGFAEALYYLYNLAGISCITVEGYVSSAYADGGYHIWNVAEIDGKYYQFDATWDCESPICEYRFCGVSTEDMLTYHSREIFQRDRAYLPDCSASLLPAVDSSVDDEKAFALLCYLHLLNEWKADTSILFFDVHALDPDSPYEQPPWDDYRLSYTEFSSFMLSLTQFMTSEAAEAFCEGRYENMNGVLAVKNAGDDVPYYRLTEVQADGDELTATVYAMTDALHGSPVTIKCKLILKDGQYYVASVSGLE